jgi:hypothetical protein
MVHKTGAGASLARSSTKILTRMYMYMYVCFTEDEQTIDNGERKGAPARKKEGGRLWDL